MDDTLKPAASGEDKKDVEAKAFFEKNKPSIKDAEKLTWDSLNEQAKELWRMRAENRQDESPPDAFTSVNELSARSWAEKNVLKCAENNPDDVSSALRRFENELAKGIPLRWVDDIHVAILDYAMRDSKKARERGHRPKKTRGNPILEFIDAQLRKGKAPKDIIDALDAKTKMGGDLSPIEMSEDGMYFVVLERGEVKFKLKKSGANSTISTRKKKITKI